MMSLPLLFLVLSFLLGVQSGAYEYFTLFFWTKIIAVIIANTVTIADTAKNALVKGELAVNFAAIARYFRWFIFQIIRLNDFFSIN